VDFFRFMLEMMGLRKPKYSFNEPSAFEMIVAWIGVLICAVIVCVLVWLLLSPVVRKVKWFIRREQCQHESCGRAWTTEVAEDDHPGCIIGKPCCNDCFDEHEEGAVLRRAAAEPKHNCVNGHGPMNKLVVVALSGHVIIDKCGKCQGVWLDRTELDKLEDLAHRRGYNSGRSAAAAASSSNLVVGIAIGSAI
jgi:hypothetical protein